MRLLSWGLFLFPVLGCSGAPDVPLEELRWDIVLLDRVDRGHAFAFEVRSFLSDGRSIEGRKFLWEIEWAGRRADDSRGRTFERQELRARGEPGTARLCVSVKAADRKLVQVAEKSFEVR